MEIFNFNKWLRYIEKEQAAKYIEVKHDKPKYYVNVYGNRIRILFRKFRSFIGGRTKFNPKWIAIGTNREKLLAEIKKRLEKLYEQSAKHNNWIRWQELAGTTNVIQPNPLEHLS